MEKLKLVIKDFKNFSLIPTINSNEKFLIIGSKGTGKTYLSKYIVEQSPSKQTCIIVDPKNFWICKLINIDEQELTNDYISVLCKWFLLYEIAIHY